MIVYVEFPGFRSVDWPNFGGNKASVCGVEIESLCASPSLLHASTVVLRDSDEGTCDTTGKQ